MIVSDYFVRIVHGVVRMQKGREVHEKETPRTRHMIHVSGNGIEPEKVDREKHERKSKTEIQHTIDSFFRSLFQDSVLYGQEHRVIDTSGHAYHGHVDDRDQITERTRYAQYRNEDSADGVMNPVLERKILSIQD